MADMYHCCVPSVCLKDGAADSAYIKDLYTAAPYANYYDLYKSTGKKAKLGSYTLHASAKGGPGVINFFIRTYPGVKIMPSDTLAMRRAYLKRILRDLDPAVKIQYNTAEMRDYADILSGTEAGPDLPDLCFAPHQLVNVLLYETDYVALACPAR